MLRGALVGAGLLLLAGLRVDVRVRPAFVNASQDTPSQHDGARSPPFVTSGEPTTVTMRNVDFHIAEGVILRIRWLRGRDARTRRRHRLRRRDELHDRGVERAKSG